MAEIKSTAALSIKGRFQLWAHDRDGKLIAEVDEENVVLDAGLTGLAAANASPGGSGRVPFAISIGDSGTLTSDPFIPIEVPPTRTDLYNQLGSTRGNLVPNWPTGLKTGFTAVPTTNTLLCQRLFDSTLMQNSDFADSSKLYLNEAMVWLGKSADDPDVDWVPFAMRTFKSVPFAPADAITVTIKWTFTFSRGTS